MVGSPEDIDIISACGCRWKNGAAMLHETFRQTALLPVLMPIRVAVGKLKEHLRSEGRIPSADIEGGGLVMCIGDSGNDVAAFCGRRVGVANARQEALEAAEFCTVHKWR